MFTGLVETTGTVVGFTPIDGGARLTLDIPFGSELSLGDSAAVNGRWMPWMGTVSPSTCFPRPSG